MFLAMNRFRVPQDREQEFIDIWAKRESYLDKEPGFVSFNLLRGESEGGTTLFASHSQWRDELSFVNWTKSESFRKAHARAGKTAPGLYEGPPQLELFESVL